MSGSMGLGMYIQYRGNFGTYTPEYGEYVIHMYDTVPPRSCITPATSHHEVVNQSPSCDSTARSSTCSDIPRFQRFYHQQQRQASIGDLRSKCGAKTNHEPPQHSPPFLQTTQQRRCQRRYRRGDNLRCNRAGTQNQHLRWVHARYRRNLQPARNEWGEHNRACTFEFGDAEASPKTLGGS